MKTSQQTNQLFKEKSPSILDTSIPSDVEENLTISQLIQKYNDESMYNDLVLGDTESAESSVSSETEDAVHIDDIIEESTYETIHPQNLVTDNYNTDSLRIYLEKECFSVIKWSNDLLFKASTDKENYEIMDITKYVGDSKYKEKKGRDSFRIFF